jgi:ubiquinone/menaquinone biosynthesis C-methylase UbiE
MRSINNITDGSYSFDRFSKNSQVKEQTRLQQQSNSLLAIDLKILHDLGLQAVKQIVDLGCGTGTMSCAIAQTYPNAKVWGIDKSDRLLDAARKLQQERHLTNIEFALGDAYKIDLSNASIDLVYGRLLFQHLAEPVTALTEIARVLKPGGKICLVDVADSWFTLNPEPLAFRTLRERLVVIQAAQSGDSQVGYKLGSYLSEAGFSNIKTRVEVVTSDRLGGIEKFLELFSFGTPYYAFDSELETLALSAREETAKLANLNYAWGAFGLFVATGIC